MKISPMFIFLSFLMISCPAFAYELQGLQSVQELKPDVHYEYTWKEKLKRAGTNLWSAPLEIKYSMLHAEEYKDKSRFWAVLEGTGRSFMRWGAGWLEFFTAPFDWPDDFKGPIYLPPRVWERETNFAGKEVTPL